ncbi:MAG: hypothetical protein JWL75_594 [Parcubacteria group bacterium]|nr:hypothetical protein [Parcubacteria group bacterium]
MFRLTVLADNAAQKGLTMYVPSIEPVDPYRRIEHTIPWETWLERWEAARTSSDVPAYLGAIHSASVITSGSVFIKSEYIECQERWMRFLLEIANDFSAGNKVYTTVRDPGKEVAKAALFKVIRVLKDFTNNTMESMSNEFVDCLFWFFRPATENPNTLHHAHLLADMPKSQREETENFIDSFAVWAWRLMPQQRMESRLYRDEALRLLAARGKLLQFMIDPLRHTWNYFTGRNCDTLRDIATRKGEMSIREALRHHGDVDAAVLYVSIRTAYNQPWED